MKSFPKLINWTSPKLRTSVFNATGSEMMAQEQEEMPANHRSEKGLAARMHKELLHLKKGQISPFRNS